MTRQRLHTDSEVCMYALTVSIIEPKNIKESMADHSWIESMQDEFNQFERLHITPRVLDKLSVNSVAINSTVTYTSVSKDDSDISSPGVDGPPIMPEDPYAYIMAAYEGPPPSPDYVPGPEEPEQAPPSPVYLPYVPEPVYPEYIPPEDDVFLAEEQPLHVATSPTAESPGYIPESDPEEDPEEDPADYPADRDDDDEEEEHPAPADSVPPVHRMTARISIRDEPSISLPPREERVRFASPTPSREVGESSAAGAARQDRPTIARDDPYSIAREDLYGFVDMVDVPPRFQEQDTQDIYAVIEDTQDRQTQIYQSVERLFDDSQYHYETARLLDQEALVSREAWGCSVEVSYMRCSKIMALCSVVIGQQAVISQLQAADRRSQVVTSEMLQADHQRQVQLTKALKLLKGLHTQMAEFQRQLGPAKGPAQPDAPGEAGSSS
ncbi:hypothetical protein Tco_1202670 [Tanacetum coccineum]